MKNDNAEKKYDVFISYCRDDSPLALTICHVLKKAGISYWFDEEAIGSGDDFSEAIAEGLLSSRVVVLISSKSSENSPFVHQEIKYANRKDVPVIPYKIDDNNYSSAMSKLLGTTNYIAAFSRAYDEFDALIFGVKRKLKQVYEDEEFIFSKPEDMFKYKYDAKTRRKIKDIKKPVGWISYAILMTEAFILVALMALFFHRVLAVLLPVCLIWAIVYPMHHKNKCACVGCGKEPEGKFEFTRLKGKKSLYFDLCKRHKYTIDYEKKKMIGTRGNIVLIILVAAAIISSVMYYEITFEKITDAFNEAITFEQTENSPYWTNEIAAAFSAAGQNTFAIDAQGEVTAFDTSDYKDLDSMKNIVKLAASNTHLILIDYDGSIYAAGQNDEGQLDIDTGGQKVLDADAADGFSVVVLQSGQVLCFGRDDMASLAFDDIEGALSVSAGQNHAVVLLDDGRALALGSNSYSQCEVDAWSNLCAVSAGENVSAGLKNDGTVVSTMGDIDWTDMVQVCAGDGIIAGLKEDGTVRLAGNDRSLSSEISSWRNIIAIDLSAGHIVGLTQDYTLLDASVDNNSYIISNQQISAGLQSDSLVAGNARKLSVSEKYGVYFNDNHLEIIGDAPSFLLVDFNAILKIGANSDTVVGLKDNGTMVVSTVGEAFQMYDWSGIKTFDICDTHVAAVKNDGSVISDGDNSYGQCDVSQIKDAADISVCNNNTIILKSDGTAEILGAMGQYSFGANNIVSVDAGFDHAAALLSDGTVAAIGHNEFGKCETHDWTDIVQIALGDTFTLGLQSDGTVLVAGAIDLGEHKTDKNIVLIGAYSHTFFMQNMDGEFLYSTDGNIQ